MKNKKYIVILCCILLAAFSLGAAGVIKVKSDKAETGEGQTKLIGVFITREYLDLFDSDRYFEENTAKLAEGGVISGKDMEKYTDRLYAKALDKSDGTDENGEPIMTKDFVFEGVEGIRFFSAHVEDVNGSYVTTISDDVVADIHLDFHSSDTEERVALSGSIYVAEGMKQANFYFNPVYETADGEIYLISGDGLFFGDELGPGASMGQTMSETRTVTEDGAETVSSVDVEVTISVIDAPGATDVLWFDADSVLLSRTSYPEGTVPASIEPVPGAAYLIAETAAPSGVRRTLSDPASDSLVTFTARPDGLCVKHEAEVLWEH
ncbi:MAG: hypothetical protein IJL78_03265 [Lachnospiraceae bacterium]|nr:hypothetical protein [Lachnospiraceae bacterium]